MCVCTRSIQAPFYLVCGYGLFCCLIYTAMSVKVMGIFSLVSVIKGDIIEDKVKKDIEEHNNQCSEIYRVDLCV